MHKNRGAYHGKTILSQSFIGIRAKVIVVANKDDKAIVEPSEQFHVNETKAHDEIQYAA